MPLYEYLCYCGNFFDSFKSYQQRQTAKCPECGRRAGKILSSRVNTYKDKAYSFVTSFGDKPVEITGRKQYERLLKRNGIADCSYQEAKVQAGRNKKSIEGKMQGKRKESVKRIINRLSKDNVNHEVREAVGKLIKGGMKNGKG